MMDERLHNGQYTAAPPRTQIGAAICAQKLFLRALNCHTSKLIPTSNNNSASRSGWSGQWSAADLAGVLEDVLDLERRLLLAQLLRGLLCKWCVLMIFVVQSNIKFSTL